MRNYKYVVTCFSILLCMCTGFAQTTKPGKAKEPATTKSPANTKASVNTKSQAPIIAEPQNPALRLGRYELYSGIPSMYLGHFILLDNGKYKIAFDTDEDNYDVSGSYVFHPDTQTIEWLGGMFKNNNWGGKFVKKENGFKIEFNKATFGESSAK